MTDKEKLMLEVIGLAYLVQTQTSYAVFIDYSGHVDHLRLEIAESADRYQNKLCATQFYVKHINEDDTGIAFLKAKRDQLLGIIESKGVDTSEMERVVEHVVSYEF